MGTNLDLPRDVDDEEPRQLNHFIWTSWKKTELTNYLKYANSHYKLMYNRLEDNFHLSNKKALFMNLKNYYQKLGLNPFEVAIPVTFHIKKANDADFTRFSDYFNRVKKTNSVWIIKPGENTNQGCGIEVSNNLQEIK